MKITVLGSTSKGNCSFVEFDNGAKIYCDAGVALSSVTTPKANAFLLITHNHKDHCASVKTWIKDYGATVICTHGTLSGLGVSKEHSYVPTIYDELIPAVALAFVRKAAEAKKNTFYVVALNTKHDAPEPCAFVVFAGKESFFYCTDTGEIPNTHRMIFDAVLIEANYTPKLLAKNLLEEDNRGYISGRVSSGVGHLSIKQVEDWVNPNLVYKPMVLLTHRSRMNFDEQEMYDTSEEFRKCAVLVENGEEYELDPVVLL